MTVVSYGEISPEATMLVNITMTISSVQRESEGIYLCMYVEETQSLSAEMQLELVGKKNPSLLT